MATITTALSYGFLLAILAIGSYITFSILRIPDLTSDGTFCLGAVISGVLAMTGHPWLGLLAGVAVSALAGLCTGLIATGLKISPILSGVLVATGLVTIIDWIPEWFDQTPSFYLRANTMAKTIFDGASDVWTKILIICAIIAILIVILLIFFQTQLGLTIRATGNNEEMVKASSINADRMKHIAFALSNGIIGLAGGLYVQFSRSYSNTMGNGMLITALASIIIAEVIFGKRKLKFALPLTVAGAVIYRFIVALVIKFVGQNAIKLGTALIVIIAIALSQYKNKFLDQRKLKRLNTEKEVK